MAEKSIHQFLIEFDIILAGIALSVGISNVVGNPSPVVVLASASFFLVAVNFFHGKMTLALDDGYAAFARVRPNGVEALEFLLHVLTVGAIAFLPFFLDAPRPYLLVHAILRLFDMLLVLLVARAARSVRDGDMEALTGMNLRWFWIDVGALAVFAVLGGWLLVTGAVPGLVVVVVVLAVGIADIAVDYFLHRKSYFGDGPQCVGP